MTRNDVVMPGSGGIDLSTKEARNVQCIRSCVSRALRSGANDAEGADVAGTRRRRADYS
jgi:hypothetical protein